MAPKRPLPEPPADGGTRLKKGARRMVHVLARFGGRPLTKVQLGTLAGVTQGGTFSNYLRAIADAGLVLVEDTTVELTAEGQDFARESLAGEPPGTEEIVAMYHPKLKAGARRMLDLLVEIYPQAMTKLELGDISEVTQGGTFSNYVRSLRSNGLAEITGTMVRASDTLFVGLV